MVEIFKIIKFYKVSFNLIRNSVLKENSLMNYGNHIFNLSIFFLPSALPIAGILLLLALIISFSKTSINIFKEKWNIYLIICSLFLILNTLYNYFNYSNQFQELERINLWIQLFNWIPLFFVFIGSQPYLKTEPQRERFIKFLLMGSMPVLLSCFLHYLNINGPFSLFNDSIVWYMKPRNSNLTTAAVAGLFSNNNYTATWLSMIWPFSITLLIKNRNKFQSLILFFITLLIFIFAILTTSRNAILGIFISTSVVLGSKSSIIIGFFILITIISLFTFNLISYGNIISFLEKNQLIILKQIFEKNLLLIEDLSLIKYLPRISIWQETIFAIMQKPFIGWGAGTFFLITNIKNIKHVNIPMHSHNMLLEIAYNYGIFITILLAAFVGLITYKIGKIIFSKDTRLTLCTTKALYASMLVALIIHMTDITYYDGKISILIWTLLASLKCILDETKFLIDGKV